MHSETIITIPVYKEQITPFEEVSFRQALSVFGQKHPLALCTFKELNITSYHNIAKEYNISLHIEVFNKTFFEGIKGYNELMVSSSFYKQFNTILYLLIYQLDAFVFRD